jgi:hypothetical protein
MKTLNALFQKTLRTAALFCCLFVCFTFTVTAQVQTNQTNHVYSTVKDVVINLTAIEQAPDGGTHIAKITNKEILASLNATGAFNFGAGAKLLARSVNGGLPYFIVRESISNEVVTTDLSAYLNLAEPEDAVYGPGSIVNWGIWIFTFTGGGGTDFTFWGFTTLHTGAIPTGNGGFLERTVTLISSGSGPGHVNGANAQFSGTVNANHARIDP